MDSIRNATLMDKEIVYDLISILEETNPNARQFSEIYEANLQNPSVYYYVYEKDGMTVGFISVHLQKLLHHTANIAEVQEIIVSPESRHCGIGSRLFQKAVSISQESGCAQLEVCCNQKRKTSHAFYYAQGMTNNHFKFCLTL